jgi:hypothetical protein
MRSLVCEGMSFEVEKGDGESGSVRCTLHAPLLRLSVSTLRFSF